MTVVAIGRGLLRLVSIATAAMAIWLASAVVLVLPSRDPGHIQVWAVVAIASGVLVGLSLVATLAPGGPSGSPLPVLSLLAVLSTLALAFGLLVAVSFATTQPAAAREDDLFVIGVLLAVHGAPGLAWSMAGLVAARPRVVGSEPGR